MCFHCFSLHDVPCRYIKKQNWMPEETTHHILLTTRYHAVHTELCPSGGKPARGSVYCGPIAAQDKDELFNNRRVAGLSLAMPDPDEGVLTAPDVQLRVMHSRFHHGYVLM